MHFSYGLHEVEFSQFYPWCSRTYLSAIKISWKKKLETFQTYFLGGLKVQNG